MLKTLKIVRPNFQIDKDWKSARIINAKPLIGFFIQGFTSELPKNGEIIPNIIGVDQSCGMYAVKLKKSKTLNDYAKLDKVIREHIPLGIRGRKTISDIVPEELKEEVKRYNKDFLKRGANDDLLKIGSLGGGNHFISIEKGKTGTYTYKHGFLGFCSTPSSRSLYSADAELPLTISALLRRSTSFQPTQNPLRQLYCNRKRQSRLE